MKIVHVVHSFYPDKGGIEIHAYSLLKEMHGTERLVYTTKSDPGQSGYELVDMIKVRRFSSFAFPGFSSVRFSPGMMAALLLDRAPDLYCSHGYGSPMPLMAAIAALIKRKPYIYTLHGYPKLAGLGGVFLWLYRNFAARIFLAIAKRVIVVSNASMAEIEGQVDPKKIVYVPNGADIQKFAGVPADFTQSDTLTYVGRIEKYKGIETLIEAFALLKSRYPKLRLAIYGKDEDYRQNLELLAKNLGVELSISQMEYGDMANAYAGSRAILMASLYEGFSLVWLEAIASGRAMFTTPVGDAEFFLKDILGADSEYFIFREANELVDKLSYFLNNQEKFKPIVARAREAVKQRYTWKNVAERTKKIYEECQ